MAGKRGIGEAELEVLRYIGAHQPATVRDVAAHFARAKGYARTTVQTVMERLRRKGYLHRTKVDGVYRYAAREEPSDLLLGLVRNFVQTALDGSPSPFVSYLVHEAALSDADVAELRRLVSELEAGEDGP